MIFTLFRRIYREHSGAHLWMPFVIVLVLSIGTDLQPLLAIHGNHWETAWKPWLHELIHGRAHELVGIYLAFLAVVLWSIWKASEVPWTTIGDLSEALEGADRYFAIGTIPLKEWFEPNPLLYLVSIIRQQFDPRYLIAAPAAGAGAAAPVIGTSFRHERVLLFSNDTDFRALQASYLDQHYARSFSAIHDRLNITLGYLRKKELNGILAQLTPEHQKLIIGPTYRPATGGAAPLAEHAAPIPPFAVTYAGATVKAIVRFSKRHNNLVVEKLPDGPDKEACIEFVKKIEPAIFKPQAAASATRPELFERCKFSKYLCP